MAIAERIPFHMLLTFWSWVEIKSDIVVEFFSGSATNESYFYLLICTIRFTGKLVHFESRSTPSLNIPTQIYLKLDYIPRLSPQTGCLSGDIWAKSWQSRLP